SGARRRPGSSGYTRGQHVLRAQTRIGLGLARAGSLALAQVLSLLPVCRGRPALRRRAARLHPAACAAKPMTKAETHPPGRGGPSDVITELEFKSLALQGHNRIPLIAEAFADLETPLSLYLKLAHAKGGGKLRILLESVVGGERFGRYSFIGLPARTFLRASGFGADARSEV